MPWELLARYFAGELEGEEKEQMKSWINENPERALRVEELREIWEQSGVPAYNLDAEKAWQRLASDMDKLDQGDHQVKKVLGTKDRQYYSGNNRENRSGRVIRRLVMAATAAVIIITAGLFAYSNYESISSQKEKVDKTAMRLITTGNGERATYTLNDGSKVILHAGSKLQVPLSFNTAQRNLYLEGEAYFEVTRDESKPFVVHSEKATTRVLGTKFLVRAWPDERNQVEVVVSEGKVALGKAENAGLQDAGEAILTKNQKGQVSDDSDPSIVNDIDMNWYMGWTEGKLNFNDRPLNEIIPKLERWYDIVIQTSDAEIGRRKLTAEIDYSQPMSEVLNGIALTLELEIEKEEGIITFHLPGK
ncbi:FecR domain-containing protein [Aliifodinibius sp. S!AR15-10]|uniref:FecR domain-containing protein n=1 Tax=Aliifodinibius sp. S!AR15-10 TaxID=2950437 RepID=UPI0028625D07|nr:FecR domain-containing protein [Aliifodinibius sp. S!AR15-10]MDR8390913.1 FecR domain-containing protein [Aliifodinibius sp. S!AR15-10]